MDLKKRVVGVGVGGIVFLSAGSMAIAAVHAGPAAHDVSGGVRRDVGGGGGPAEIIAAQTPQERADNVAAQSSPEAKEALRQLQAQVASGSIPVTDRDGRLGYMDPAGLQAPAPRSVADLFAVRDHPGGSVVFYYGGGGVGVVEKDVVESGQPIDFAAVKATNDEAQRTPRL